MTGRETSFQEVENLLEQALAEVRSGDDATATISRALAAHRVLLGELPAEEIADYESPCVCPPDLLERGGFKGNCPRHGHVQVTRRLS